MSKHMTIINLACTITKLRKWGEAWKHSAESAQAATAGLVDKLIADRDAAWTERDTQAADHSRQLAEHRAAFGARTEADAKIIAGLRSEIGAAQMAVLERDSLISERAKLQSIINKQSASAKEAGEKLGWTGNESAIQAVERVVKERDGLLTQVQDMRAEIERLQWENKTMHKDAEDGYAAAIKVLGDPVALSKERDALRAEVAALKSQNPKQHPVKVGEWVRRTDAECDGIYFGRGVIAQVLDILDAPENQYTVSRPEWNGYTVPWAMQYCEPCDPPEATHDTEAGKAVAESAVSETVAEEIKVGDVAKVVGASGDLTAQSDIGKIGEVLKIDFGDGTVRLSGAAGWVDRCDVRKVTT